MGDGIPAHVTTAFNKKSISRKYFFGSDVFTQHYKSQLALILYEYSFIYPPGKAETGRKT
jgi:hypothetical protein